MAGVRFPLAVVIQAVDKLTGPVSKIQAKIRNALRPLDQLGKSVSGLAEASGLPRLYSALGRVKAGVGDVFAQVTALGRKLLWIGGIGGAGILGLANSFAHAGEELIRLSAKLNVTVEGLQELRHWAKQNEVGAETLERSLNFMNKGLGQAAQGKGKLLAAAKRLGVALETPEGKLKSLEELLPEVADALNNLDDEGKRTALTMDIFGRSGADMIPALRTGSHGMIMMAQEARALGLVMSREAAEGGDAFGDAQNRVIAALTGLRNAAGGALLPTLTELANKLARFLVDHRADIERFARAFAQELPRALERTRDFLVEVWTKSEPLRNVVSALVERFGALQVAAAAVAVILGGKLLVSVITLAPALIELGTVLFGTVIPAFISVATTIFTTVVPSILAFTAALLTNPITWVVIAIVALVAAGIWLVKNWDKVAGFFVWLWKTIRDAFKAAFDWVIENVPFLLGPVGLVIKHWSKIKAFFLALWPKVKELFAKAVEWVKEYGLYLLGPVGLIIKHWDRVKQFFLGLWDTVREVFGNIVEHVREKVGALGALLPDWLKEKLGISVAASGPEVAPKIAAAAAAANSTRSEAKVKVSFENAPKGARVVPQGNSGVDLDLSMGYSMLGAGS